MRLPRRTFVDTLESQIAATYKRPGFIMTHEVLAFQNNDKFGAEMEAVCQKYLDLVNSGASSKVIAEDKELSGEFTSLIKSRFKIKVELKTNSHSAAVIPNFFIPHNPITSDYFRNYAAGQKNLPGAKEIAKMVDKNLGTVSLQDATVSGWFSEQTSPIFINFRMLYKDYKLSPAEVTAVVLHEIGHIFNAIAFLNRQHTTNRVLSDLAQYLSSNKEKPDVDYVYREVKKLDEDASRDIAEGLISGNAPVMGVTLYRLAVGTMNSLLPDDTYDRVQFESNSDVFATRFGYGEAIVTGLEKIEAVYPEKDMESFRSVSIIKFGLMTTFFIFFSIFSFMTGAAFIGALYSAFSMLMVWVLGIITGARGKFKIYDSIRDRYMRVRNQIVENIKDPTIDGELKANLLEQIAKVDAVLENKQNSTFFADSFMDTFNPRDRRAKKSIENQQKIEAMVANDLFVQAARLRT